MSASQSVEPTRRGIFTVSGQLAAVVAVGISIGFLIVIGMQIERSRTRLLDIELDTYALTSEMFATQLYGAVRWRKPAIIRKAYDTLVNHADRGVAAAVTVGREGDLLTAYHRDAAASVDLMAVMQSEEAFPSDDEIYTTMVNDQFIVIAPVTSDDRLDRSGTFAIAWSLEGFNAMAEAAMLREGAIALFAVGAFVAAALLFISRRLGRPLGQITEATNRIANGDKTFDVPWTKRRDEIGDMARALVTFRENVALIDRMTADQQQQTQRLSTALEKEKEYNALHREFVTMVSHEFRTPMAIIDGAAQRIERRIGKDTPERLQERIVKIRSAVTRMIELIDSTLSVSRIESGAIDLEVEACDFAALLKDICQRQQDISKKHEINLVIADLPASVSIDGKRMDQVFTNLLSNAVKYAPDAPKIDVKAGTVGQNIVVSVRDFGVGIPKDELPKLFEKFFRASTSTGIPGTGIGLHLVKHLIELHQGTITLDSIEGEGSTFSVTFPILQAERKPDSTAAENAPPAAATA